MIVNILKAIIELGLPLALLSWLIFMRLFVSGELDRQADRKRIERGVKKIKASFKSEKKKKHSPKNQKPTSSSRNGCISAVAFTVWQHSGHSWSLRWVSSSASSSIFPGFDVLFGDGLISFLFNLGMNQLSNLISAFVWFSYWDGSMLIWTLVAYAGYLAGIEAARRNLKVSKETLLEQVRRRPRG